MNRNDSNHTATHATGYEKTRAGDQPDANRDPITGEPGSHPVGTTVGAAAAGTAGAIVGALGGPVGIVVGTALGVAAGAAVGRNAAETVNPTVIDIEPELRDTFANRPYASSGSYEDYRGAYAFGAQQRSQFDTTRAWDDELETQLRSSWEQHPDAAHRNWDEVRPAVRDAWGTADERLRAHQARREEY